jgi:uncharacterized protein YbbC (DUF1343 family)
MLIALKYQFLTLLRKAQRVKVQSLKLGVETFLDEGYYKRYLNQFLALLTNQSACLKNLTPSYFALSEALGERLKFLFSPQHGFFAEKQANMVASNDEVEPFFGLRVVSLYGPRLKPEPKHLQGIDVVLVDLPDVGCRVYTYIWTMFLLMSACENLGVKVLVFDRPNPIGSQVEGPLLEKEYYSFVGLDSLPLRHGRTIGEIALLFKKRHFPRLELEVVPCRNYKKSQLWLDLPLPWINPSPNLPDFYSALCYPGLVLLEGTNLSEGRGTTKPFTTFGAPYLKIEKLYPKLKELFPEKDWGVVFRPLAFEPTFDKWKGKRCYGFEIHVTKPLKFRPVEFGLKLLKLIKMEYSEFEFLPPPYEFEMEKKPIEILVGSKEVLEWLMEKDSLEFDLNLSYTLKRYQLEISNLSLYED